MVETYSPNKNNVRMEYIVLFTIFLSYDDGPVLLKWAFLNLFVFIRMNCPFQKKKKKSAKLYGQLTAWFCAILSKQTGFTLAVWRQTDVPFTFLKSSSE